jgi:type II secretory pathway pseudopilin PulG
MRNENGQSLIELMVSIAIITTALSGIVAIFPFIIEKNARIQMQNKAIYLAQSELEKLRALAYFDKELDAFGTTEGMSTMKEIGDYLMKTNIKYIDSKTGTTPKQYPLEVEEDTGLKEIKISVKRKDNIGTQVDFISYFSKARPPKG